MKARRDEQPFVEEEGRHFDQSNGNGEHEGTREQKLRSFSVVSLDSRQHADLTLA